MGTMLTAGQVNIFKAFSKDPFAPQTFKDIKKISGQNSNNMVQMAIRRFEDHAMVTSQKVGNVTRYLPNLANDLTVSTFNLINALEWQEEKDIPKDLLRDLVERISKQTYFFVLLVFGSHAEHKAKEKSDLDIALIVDSPKAKKDVLPYIETIKRREIIPLDAHVFTKDEFLSMLADEEANLGKEIYRKSKIYYGLTPYLLMISRSPYGNPH